MRQIYGIALLSGQLQKQQYKFTSEEWIPYTDTGSYVSQLRWGYKDRQEASVSMRPCAWVSSFLTHTYKLGFYGYSQYSKIDLVSKGTVSFPGVTKLLCGFGITHPCPTLDDWFTVLFPKVKTRGGGQGSCDKRIQGHWQVPFLQIP